MGGLLGGPVLLWAVFADPGAELADVILGLDSGVQSHHFVADHGALL